MAGAVLAITRAPMASYKFLDHPHDGVERLLGAMAGKELMKNAPTGHCHILVDTEHQLQCSTDSDSIVAGLVGPDAAVSNHDHLVLVQYNPDGGDQVLISKH